jgi:HlyD family secretion protein
VETIISAEATGIVKNLNVAEGRNIPSGASVGYIDSTQLYLKKKQLEAQVRALLGKKPDISKQLAALMEELHHAEREHRRLTNLVQSDAATEKQLDDASANLNILRRRIAAQESNLGITTASLMEETLPLRVQIEQLEDQLSRCKIVNAVGGTVLTKYVEEHEMVLAGKPLYRIADLSTVILRVYLTGDQIAGAKLNQKVTVYVDKAGGDYNTYPGTLIWISDKAEFTPKTIQTKDERANLVYAVKIAVKNDGLLKIGMYGEIKL